MNLNQSIKLPFFTLVMMISFASVNAVLFTPALPMIAKSFAISSGAAQLTITWFLIGYALGQLLYGPIANRFGRKPALYTGIFLQIFSSFLCVFAGLLHAYFLLVLGRFLLALGSGVGLKMTFTLLNESYDHKTASRKIAHLMTAFAITPGLAVMLGGLLVSYFNWTSTFYACAAYGVVLLLAVRRFPETKTSLDYNALQPRHLVNGYIEQFKNLQLVKGGLLMGSATCYVYSFAALAPFVAMSILHLGVAQYGTANLLPPLGLIIGSIFSGEMVKHYKLRSIINLGIGITLVGSLFMLLFALMHMSAIITLFIPMMLCYFGLACIFANASVSAMTNVADKAHGSAVMNFLNMGTATVIVLSLGLLSVKTLLLPVTFVIMAAVMFLLNF